MPGPVFDTITERFLPSAKAGPDFERMREEPRYLAMGTAAEEHPAASRAGQADGVA